MIRLLQLIWRSHEGTALIEGTVVMPFLFLLMFGVYEFSWFFYQEQLISSGLRDAARYISRTASPIDPTCNPSVWPIAKNLAVYGTTSAGTPRVNGWTTGMVTVSCSLAPTTTDVYVVTVSTIFAAPSLGFIDFLFPGLSSFTISLSHQERIFGVG